MLKAEPTVCGVLIALNKKWSRTPGLTVKLSLVPDMPEPAVEIEMLGPAPVTVT
jgi:hypothetical protein